MGAAALGAGATTFGGYAGRTVHIHVRVAVGRTEGTAYEGGTIDHTGQLVFDEAVSNGVYPTAEYVRSSDDGRVLYAEDGILADHEDQSGSMVEISQG